VPTFDATCPRVHHMMGLVVPSDASHTVARKASAKCIVAGSAMMSVTQRLTFRCDFDAALPLTPPAVSFVNRYAQWYLGQDGAVGSNQQDLITIMLHELAHGFGVSHSFSADGTFGYQSGVLRPRKTPCLCSSSSCTPPPPHTHTHPHAHHVTGY
jgi:hypothetical protein